MLYLSMIVFGLTPYAYGTATFIVPELLLLAAVLYLVRKWAAPVDLVICVLLFVAVAGPYFLTLAIQTFDWETVMIGPFSLPRFEKTLRANDIALFAGNPYEQMIRNLGLFFEQFLVKNYEAEYNIVFWAQTMYPFMTPVWLCGFYLWWRTAREAAPVSAERKTENTEELFFRMLTFWIIGSAVNGVMTTGVVNRQNTVFYPLIFLSAYGIREAGRRMRLAGTALTAMLFVSFVCLMGTYFGDEGYIGRVGQFFHDGYQEALTTTREWDYDHYYILDGSPIALSQLMFAHDIDYELLSEEKELPDREGNPSGWYFSDRYIFIPGKPELNPTDCAVYIFPKERAQYFNSDEYQITEFGLYCAAYPRCWL